MSLQPGNSKLGPMIASWSISAVDTCPGRSALCVKLCYASHGHFLFPAVKRVHKQNWLELSKSDDFVGWMCSEIRRLMLKVVRVHVAGDFYDAAYTEKWLTIARRNPGIVFFAYSRSWREASILPGLKALARQPNFLLWFSCDRETGAPPRVPGVRRAYMSENDSDTPRFKVDMVFRDKTGTVRKFDPSGALVCPVENGVTKTNCSKCGLCWHKREIPREQIANCETR